MTSTEEPVASIEMTKATSTPIRALTPILETESGTEDSTITFHLDADLKVIIQGSDDNPAIYMVCASALACASPIWRSMLYRDAAHARGVKDEAGDNQVQTLELESDSKAISLLFHIVHYDFSHVPQEPTLNQLFELCKSACQYRCTHLFYPWANQWTSRLANFVAEADCYSECHKALYVAWTFGEMKLYRDTVDALIVSTKVDFNGKIVNVSGQPLEDMLMPLELLEIITKARASTIAKILDAVRAPIHVLSSGAQSERGVYCKVGKDTQPCEIMMLGSVIPALTKAGLFPVPEPEKFTGSIEGLKDTLDKVKTIPYVGREWMPHMSHESCNLGFRESVMICLKEMAVPLSSSIMSWMSDQAYTCGIKSTTELQQWRQRSEESSPKRVEQNDLVTSLEEQAEENCEAMSAGSAQEKPEGES
ncbi:hypothetical protein GGR51DRAFT_562030 [Nemania sp. FL0031]|nr:hypothetical protein GGR51DRAFT_562030 [Nemania sp. FL0031]